MILLNCNAFPKSGRILGIDWGQKRIGIAISDESRDFVFTRPPIIVSKNDNSAPLKIARLAKKENVVGIVMGLPLHSDRTESKTTTAVRRCAEEICSYAKLPILFIEENLTSIIAQQEMPKVKIDEIKQKLDSESARLILENAIAVLKRNK